MTTDRTAFWADAEYDREHSSDGSSRYAAYIRQASFDPFTDADRHVELAEFAWRQATTPVMSPGYVRRHPRILSVQLERSDWDGSLIACVDLVMPQPRPLAYLRADDRGMWSDWPSEHSFAIDRTVWHEPGGEDLARSRYLLCTASLRFVVPSGDLPQPDPAGADAGTCKESVAVLVRELNAVIGPVIARIEGG